VKVAKPQQDRRFDVPTIGTQTIETLYKAGGRVLAVEANNTILLDEAETIALADRYGLSVVAL
jgi:UDP-2,3-diacylglucosamine hydrolase